MKEYIRPDQLMPEQNYIQVNVTTETVNLSQPTDKGWQLLLALIPVLAPVVFKSWR